MHWTRAVMAIGLVGQAGAVARIGDLGIVATLLLLVTAVVAAILLTRAAPATALMIGWGGFGMTLGWWADLGFRSAVEVAQHSGIDAIWCRTPALGSAWHVVPGVGHLVSWMNAGMLLFGVPAAAFLLRPWSMLRCTLGMILGMSAGSRLAATVASGLDPAAAVLVDHALMSAAMIGGMLGIEHLPWPRAQMPRNAAIATSAQPAIVTRKPAAPA
jgi:hypothetical protein